MKRQTIAIDVDDVLAVHYPAVVEFHNENFGSNHTLDDYVTDHWHIVWGTDPAETERRAAMFADSGLHLSFEPVPGAIEALKALKDKFDLVIVTARRKINIERTHDWLDKHFPGLFKDVRFVPIWEAKNSVTKADICKELNADYLIDDSLKHCLVAYEAGLTAILFGNYPWNQARNLGGVIRVNDWQETLEVLSVKSQQSL